MHSEIQEMLRKGAVQQVESVSKLLSNFSRQTKLMEFRLVINLKLLTIRLQWDENL